jgi:DNA-binding CsgD family transcriptional regulator
MKPDEVDMSSNSTDHGTLQTLSQREREILKLVAEGKTSREIAERLSISPKTVDTTAVV